MFRFDNTYARLPEKFYARVAPAKVPKPELIKWNTELAGQLGAQAESPPDVELAEVFTGQKLLPGSEPIALVYAGHQFGHFVHQLGDGRALLMGEVVDPSGRRHDIQLKGSGRTPFSRGGDGKAPLGPVLREYLVSEALHHLGLSTTRSLGACRRNGIRSRFVLIWLHYGKDIQILRPKTNAAPAIFDGLAPERASRVFLIRCGRAA